MRLRHHPQIDRRSEKMLLSQSQRKPIYSDDRVAEAHMHRAKKMAQAKAEREERAAKKDREDD